MIDAGQGVILRSVVSYVGAPEIRARRLVLAIRYHRQIGNPGQDVEEEITTIGSGSEHRYSLAVTRRSDPQSERVVHVLIQWDDDSGEPQR